MKRFVETSDWRNPNYRRLSSQAKHLRRYLWDNCDCAGVIPVDFEAFSFHIGEAIEEKHLAELGDWTEALNDGRLLIPSFIHFQSGELSDACRAHLSILKAIRAHNLVRSGSLYHRNPDSLSSDVPLSPDRGQLQLKVQEQEKEQDKYKDYPPNLRTAAFDAAWQEWKTFRTEIRKKLTPTSIRKQFKDLSEVGEVRAIATINISISNSYQGLFPERTHATNQRNHSTGHQRTTGADQRKVGIPAVKSTGNLSDLLAARARKATANSVAAKASSPQRDQSGGSTHG